MAHERMGLENVTNPAAAVCFSRRACTMAFHYRVARRIGLQRFKYVHNNPNLLTWRLLSGSSPTPLHTKGEDAPQSKSPASSRDVTSPSSILPGLGLAAGTALGGFQAASILSDTLDIPVSGIPTSILFGMAVKNTVGYDTNTFQPGLVFATKTILQTGIVCVAAKLSFLDMVTTGSQSVPVVIASVGAGMLFLPIAGAWAGLPPRLSLLLTAGTSICGVTAITALAPAIQATPREIAIAVANTVAFGTVGMLCYPYVLHELCQGNSVQVGMCLGVAIHDTSQVLGSAMAYKETFDDQLAFQVAAVTKLVRNLGLAVAIPTLTYVYHKEHTAKSTGERLPETMSGLSTFSKYVPPFLVAFLGMSALRSGGDVMLSDVEVYSQIMNWIGNDLSKYALGTAMAGVGLSTSASSLQGVGWKPFAVGGAGALVVGGTGFTVATLVL